MTHSPQALSVVVLTLNEGALITRCLSSVWWADELVVVDSGSTDRTREIAATYGATVIDQPWLGWSAQRTVGIAAAKHDWVMVLEADELPDEVLAAALRELDLEAADPRNAYSVDRRGDWLGVLLPNDQRPSKIRSFVRVFHRKHSYYDPDALVHERVLVPHGRITLLPGVLIHWRDATLYDYVAMINRYSEIEADEAHRLGLRPSLAKVVAMPVVRFIWLYLARRNALLGKRGLLLALHGAQREYLRQAKAWERVYAQRVLHPPARYRPERPPTGEVSELRR